ncbi:unnamed protein product [Ceutorhynchus assimilis]|uniref:Uncharacterized protein n=1 Tax=Ceutorhynchus assimilis TaxID=467358 RepID=A0A9N9MDC2_9CUCU|nr:unnamed protein product [Ceutorhynchus assimilis]
MLTLLFMLWSLIRNITKSVTGRVTPPNSLTPEEGGVSGNSLGDQSDSILKMGQNEKRIGMYNGIYSVVKEKRKKSASQAQEENDDSKEIEEISQSYTPSPEPTYSPTPSPELGEFLKGTPMRYPNTKSTPRILPERHSLPAIAEDTPNRKEEGLQLDPHKLEGSLGGLL